MRKSIGPMLLVLGMITLFLSVSEASEQAAQVPPVPAEDSARAEKAEGTPRIVFEESEHDFGTIGEQQTVKHTFTFKNDGDATLVIDSIKTTCGCTGTLLSDKEILPGKTGNIEVTFKSGRSGGQKKKSIIVYSNDSRQAQLRLYIMANVVIPIEVRPSLLYWVAEANVASVRRVELLYKPDLAVNITGLEISSPAFIASVQPKNDADAPGYAIDVQYDGGLPIGPFRETLTILTDNPQRQKLVVHLRGKVTGPVKVMPDTVNFGVIRDDAVLTRVIRVHSTKKDDFEVTGVESTNPLISTELSKLGGIRGYEIKVTLKEKPSPGAFSGKLLVKTNDPSQNPLEILVYAFVR
jgi:hypothetical protein